MIVTATEKQLAEILQITDRHVRDLFSSEKREDGTYPLVKCFKKYIQQSRGDQGEYVTQKTLAEILGISEKTVRKLEEHHVLRRNENGKYGLKENLKNYLQSKDEIYKLKKAQREMQEFKLKVYKDEFIKKEAVELALCEVMLQFKAKLISCINKLEVGLDNEELSRKEILEKYILGALEEFAGFEFPSNQKDMKKEVEQ